MLIYKWSDNRNKQPIKTIIFVLNGNLDPSLCIKDTLLTRCFSVNEKCVWRWRSQKENLKKMPCSKRARWGKVPNFLNLKKTLLHGLLQRDKKELQYLQL